MHPQPNKAIIDKSRESINNFTNYIYNTITTNQASAIFYNLFIGQFLAILSVINGIFSQQIETYHKVVAPLLMTSSYYFLVAIIWLTYNKFTFRRLKLVYLLITLIDSQANCINIYVFSVIQFEYPFIINFCSVIWTCLFTWLFITKYKYKKTHILGISIAFIGVIITLYGTIGDDEANVDKLLDINVKGFLLCLFTSLLYSINGILQEKYLTSNEEIYDFFPWMGMIGSVISFIEGFWLGEMNRFDNAHSINVAVLWAGFTISLTFFTSMSPFFISRCSASMFNFSLASTIFWSAIVNVIVNRDFSAINLMFFIGFIVIIAGLLVFYLKKMQGEYLTTELPTIDTANDEHTRGFIMSDVMSEVSDCDVNESFD